MKAIVVQFNIQLPTVQAVTDNKIAIAFRLPPKASISLSDELDIDLERLGVEQSVLNVTTGERMTLTIMGHDVHDLRLAGGHGTSRFPSLSRRRGDIS